MRTATLVTLFFFFAGCDGMLYVRGYVVQNSSVSGRVDSLRYPPGAVPVGGAVVNYGERLERDSTLCYGPEVNVVTDPAGYFSHSRTVAPWGRQSGVLIVEKEGFKQERIYFPYSSLDTVKFIVNMTPLP